ncbi:MAG: peroxiredoxin [Mucilaginibacter sp.]|nr:peroxiredoxin [Mucilaginibacter sp.]
MEVNKQFVEEANAQIGVVKYRTVITSAGHTIISDEPESMEGADSGMNPYSLLLASLGSCTAITLRMYINRKMWIIEDISVKLQLFKTDTGIIIERRLNFSGGLTAQQKDRLLFIANACPIHKILIGNIAITTEME